MKNLLLVLFTVVILFFLSFSGCKKEDSVTSNQSTMNNLVVTSVPNAFTFVVDAAEYNYSETNQLQINADTLSIAITVSSHSSGSGSITIKDDNNTFSYTKDLSNAMVSADVMKLSTVPKTVDIILSNYTGKITIAVAGK